MGKNDGEGSPNWCSSNDPDPVDCVELDPVYTSVLSSAIWQIYSRKKNQKNNSECSTWCPRLFFDLENIGSGLNSIFPQNIGLG